MRFFRRGFRGRFGGALAGFFLRGLPGFRSRLFGRRPGWAAGRLPSEGFGGFLARFLGHTPSFRRFRRINHWDIAGLVLAKGSRAGCWANLMSPEYGYKEFEAPPVRSFNVLPRADDE